MREPRSAHRSSHAIPVAKSTALATLVALLGTASAWATAPPPADGDAHPTAVRVERVRPRRETLPTLRFLKTNREFLRGRLDLLREQPLAGDGDAAALDPRFLAYHDMMRDALAATDSVDVTSGARERQNLLASVGEFARLESELDQMERLLAGQRTRLTALQADFTGRQRTSLAIVVSGYPQGAGVDSLTLRFDDGTSRTAPLSREERESLLHGGVLELFRGLVEPREQVIEVQIDGEGVAAPAVGYLTLDPTRDRLSFLRLDLSPLRAGTGAPEMLATTWLNDDALSAADEPSHRP